MQPQNFAGYKPPTSEKHDIYQGRYKRGRDDGKEQDPEYQFFTFPSAMGEIQCNACPQHHG
jgi:hypothetical protein